MITAIVRFKVPADVTLEKVTALFQDSTPKYVDQAGLTRKYYLYSEDGIAGGVYLWESRAAADALYTDEWKAMITERYGAPPDIQFFETPVIVDNQSSEVLVDAAA